jgi:Ca2+-transporting ATPase
VVVGSLNDWQKERKFKVFNEKKEECGVKVICNGVEHLIDVKVCWFPFLIRALSHYRRCALRDVSQEVVVGDVALLELGEIVPCDGIFLSGHNVKCDESAATGESDAIKKASCTDCLVLKSLNGVHTEGGALGGEQHSKAQHVSTHMDCFVVSGSKVLEGVGSYVVVAVGTKSFNGRIMMGARVF